MYLDSHPSVEAHCTRFNTLSLAPRHTHSSCPTGGPTLQGRTTVWRSPLSSLSRLSSIARWTATASQQRQPQPLFPAPRPPPPPPSRPPPPSSWSFDSPAPPSARASHLFLGAALHPTDAPALGLTQQRAAAPLLSGASASPAIDDPPHTRCVSLLTPENDWMTLAEEGGMQDHLTFTPSSALRPSVPSSTRPLPSFPRPRPPPSFPLPPIPPPFLVPLLPHTPLARLPLCFPLPRVPILPHSHLRTLSTPQPQPRHIDQSRPHSHTAWRPPLGVRVEIDLTVEREERRVTCASQRPTT